MYNPEMSISLKLSETDANNLADGALNSLFQKNRYCHNTCELSVIRTNNYTIIDVENLKKYSGSTKEFRQVIYQMIDLLNKNFNNENRNFAAAQLGNILNDILEYHETN